MQGIEVCALTPQQEKAWSDTRVALLWHQPAFAHILYTLLDTSNSKYVAVFTKDSSVCPIAATDGNCIIINPDTFFQFNLNMRVFILVHEIFHCIWNHLALMYNLSKRGKVSFPDGTTLPYDAETMNIAADLVINDLLIESHVGEMPALNGKQVGMHDKSLACSKDSAIDAYKKVYKRSPPPPPGGQGPCTNRGLGQGFDTHLKPGQGQGKEANQAVQDRNEAEWQTQVASAMNAARLQGKLHANLDRAFAEILEPQVDWRERIQALFARKVGSGTYDWRRPDRRLIARKDDPIICPGRSGYGANCVIVAGDTSGSIHYGPGKAGNPSEGDMFLAEIAGILDDVRPKRVILVWCDAKVHRVDEIEDVADLNVIRAKGVGGGGGTSFVPVFDYIKANGLEPDALVYLTDGQGTFPSQAPKYPVIWGNIFKGAKYPFGDVVDVPKQAA